jgi:hypothetical protein
MPMEIMRVVEHSRHLFLQNALGEFSPLLCNNIELYGLE